MALIKKGCFSYLENKATHVVIDSSLTARIEPIDNHVARIFLVDKENAQVAVPDGIRMMDLNNGVAILPYQNTFFMTWMDSYVLMMGDQAIIELTNQKEQSISAPATAAVL